MGRPGNSVEAVHRRLREDILSGRLPPGSTLPQAQLAERYGVSRTPLREALRMLREEGLVSAVRNQRARVRDFDLDDVESISAQRIVLAALATYITVGLAGFPGGGDLEAALAEVERAARSGDEEAWVAADRAFHALHEGGAPAPMLEDLRRLGRRNAIYQSIWSLSDGPEDHQSVDEHRAIVDACASRDAAAAMCAIARHQARIGITVLARAVPEREPAAIRAALHLVLGEAAGRQLTRVPARRDQLPA